MTRTLFTNARAFTANLPGQGPAWAEAIVTDGARILFAGDAAVASRIAGTDAECIDLDGRIVIPGVFEAHAHLGMLGESLGQVRLRDAVDLAEIQHRVRAARAASPDAPRVLGAGWLFDAIPDGHPDRHMLDEAVPDVPVYLTANDLHSTWVNSAALAELGITPDTDDPVGGRISRDSDGVPDGLLIETATQFFVWRHLERVTSDADRDAAARRAITAYLETGVTGAADMAFTEGDLACWRRVAQDWEGGFPFHLVAYWLIDNTGDEARNLAQVQRAIELAEATRRDAVRVIGIKLITDGAIDGCMAAMSEPYSDGSNEAPIWPLADMLPVVRAADAAGLQIALHAIGDLACSAALDAFETIITEHGPRDRPRKHRIEHLEYTEPGTAERLASLGITASMQPVHCDPAILDTWLENIGAPRTARGFAWNEIRQAGARLAFSTDAPSAPHEALPNLFIAATRRSALDPTRPAYLEEHAIDIADAVGCTTREAAASIGEEHSRGRLAPGLAADFVVLDRDPFTDGADSFLDARVLRTVVAGESVFPAPRSGDAPERIRPNGTGGAR